MDTRQNVAATYNDKKVLDDRLKVGDLLYVYLPQNQRVKLALKWMGVAKLLQEHHPSYQVEIPSKNGNVRKWKRSEMETFGNGNVLKWKRSEMETF